jgi:hypothetical protein
MKCADEIDGALHEIQQMVECAIRAAEGLTRVEHDKQKFEMPARDAQLLDFSILDIAKRVEALRTDLYPRESAKALVLTLIPSRPDLSI